MKKTWTVEIDGEEKTLSLVTKYGYLSLPVGTVMYSLLGDRVVIGEDEIDQRMLDGYLNYGILEEGDVD